MNRFISAGLAFAAATTVSSAAFACGGFFCSQLQPVDQSGERILFVQEDANTVTAHVQISYVGPSSEFSWVVPVPTQPEIQLSSDMLFTALDDSTRPVAVLQQEVVGTCREEPDFSGGEAMGDDAGMANADAGTGGRDGGVTVLDIGVVGALDYAVIEGESIGPMIDWLEVNGYDVIPGSEELLNVYVSGGMPLVAFKLTKLANAGDLQPIAMTYESTQPMIPIQLTAIAAEPEMRVLTWIAAEQFAYPQNYDVIEYSALRLSVLGEETAGLEAMRAYDKLAMTHEAHVMASSARQRFSSFVPSEGLTDRLPDTDEVEWALDEVFFGEVGSLLQTDPLAVSVLTTCFVLPEEMGGVEPIDFFNCTGCFPEIVAETRYDREACVNVLEERIVAPREFVAEQLELQDRLSRFSTWLSAEDMTRDPVFCYDATAEPRELSRQVNQVTYCAPDRYRDESPMRLDTDGFSIYVDPSQSRWSVAQDLPAVMTAYRTDCGGTVETTVDTTEQMTTLAAESSEWFDDTYGSDPTAAQSGNERGCAAASGATGWLALVLLGFVRRRRR